MKYDIYRANTSRYVHGPVYAGTDAYLCRGCAVDASANAREDILVETLECNEKRMKELKAENKRVTIYSLFQLPTSIYEESTIDNPVEVGYLNERIEEHEKTDCMVSDAECGSGCC